VAPPAARRRDAAWIVCAGVAVAVAPAYWVPRVWAGPLLGGFGGWLWVAVPTVLPFALLASLRAAGLVGWLGTLAAACAGAVVAVLLQLAALNPADPSSTAPIAVVFIPLLAGIAVAVVAAADAIVRHLLAR
jgi:hypothetical protein